MTSTLFPHRKHHPRKTYAFCRLNSRYEAAAAWAEVTIIMRRTSITIDAACPAASSPRRCCPRSRLEFSLMSSGLLFRDIHSGSSVSAAVIVSHGARGS